MGTMKQAFLKFMFKDFDLSNPQDAKRLVQTFEDLSISSNQLVGWVATAIHIWGIYLSKGKIKVYKVDKEGNYHEQRNHPLAKAIRNPNPIQNAWTVKYRWGQHWGLFGRTYLRVFRDNSGRVKYLYQLAPFLVEKVKSGSGFVYVVKVSDDKEETLTSRDIIEIKLPHPTSDILGRPVISGIEDEVTVNKYQMAYAREFYKKGGFLGATFTTDKELSTVSFDRTKKMLQEEYGGELNSYNIAVFDSGLKPIPSAYSIKDMAIADNRKITREEILSAFQVPKILTGLEENYNKATADTAIYSFASTVIDPLLINVTESLTQYAQQFIHPDIEVKHDTLAPKDVEGMLKYFESMSGMGALTINEMRKFDGKNPFEFELADVPIINLGGNAIRIDTAEIIGQEEPEEKPTPEEEDDPKEADTAKDGVKSMSDLRWKQFDRRHTYQLKKTHKNVKEFMDSQRRRIIEALEDNMIVGGVFDLKQEDIELYQLLEIEIYEIMKTGYKWGNHLYDNPLRPSVLKTIRDYKGIINAQMKINQTTKKSLDAIEVGNGISIEEAKDQVTDLFSKARIEKISLTMTTGGMNAGFLQAMREAGIKKKMWLTMRDSKVRQTLDGEDHAIMEGKIVGIDEKFIIPSRSGADEVMYPADPSASLENVINERCTIIGA